MKCVFGVLTSALHCLETSTCICVLEAMHGMQQWIDAATVLCLGDASPTSGL